MRIHPQKGPYPKHNTPGTRGASPVRSCTLCLIQKSQKKLDWLRLTGKNFKILHLTGTNRLLAVVRPPNSKTDVFLNGKEASDCFLVPDRDPDADDFAKADCMSKHHSSLICCFLYVHFYSKIDYTFTLSDQCAWLATKCPHTRVPKQKIVQQKAAKQ